MGWSLSTARSCDIMWSRGSDGSSYMCTQSRHDAWQQHVDITFSTHGKESLLIPTLILENLADLSTECFSLHLPWWKAFSQNVGEVSDLKVGIRELAFPFYAGANWEATTSNLGLTYIVFCWDNWQYTYLAAPWLLDYSCRCTHTPTPPPPFPNHLGHSKWVTCWTDSW